MSVLIHVTPSFTVGREWLPVLTMSFCVATLPQAERSSLWNIRRVKPTRCKVSQFIYFWRLLCMFQTVFPSIIRSSKLHIRRQVFVRPILLPAPSLAGMKLVYMYCWLYSANIQGVSKRALQLWKLIEIYTEDIHNVLNCQNIAKHTEFYLG